MPLERTTRSAVIVLVGEAGDVTKNRLIAWMEELGYERRAAMAAISDLVLSGVMWSRHGRLRLRPMGQKLYEGHVKETGES